LINVFTGERVMRGKITVIVMTAAAALLGGCETEKQGSFGDNYSGRDFASGGVVSERPGDWNPDEGGGGRHDRRRR
jgi:hypothetical protein